MCAKMRASTIHLYAPQGDGACVVPSLVAIATSNEASLLPRLTLKRTLLRILFQLIVQPLRQRHYLNAWFSEKLQKTLGKKLQAMKETPSRSKLWQELRGLLWRCFVGNGLTWRR